MAPKIHAAKENLPVESMGDYQGRSAELGDYVVAFESVPAGFPPGGARAFAGLPDDSCQSPHWGYLFKGRFRIRFTDGREEIVSAGSAYHIPSGHQFEALEHCETVEFSPKDLLSVTMAVVAKNLEVLMAE